MSSVKVMSEKQAVKRWDVGLIPGSDERLDSRIGDVDDHIRATARLQFGEDLEEVEGVDVGEILFGHFNDAVQQEVLFVHAWGVMNMWISMEMHLRLKYASIQKY